MPDTTVPQGNAFDRAVAKIKAAADHDQLARLLVSMLLPVGDTEDWDSETIELVLAPTWSLLKRAGLPWIGTATGSSLATWRAIGRAVGMEYDDEEDTDD